MISGVRELVCWEEGDLDCEMESESEFEEDMDENGMRDIER